MACTWQSFVHALSRWRSQHQTPAGERQPGPPEVRSRPNPTREGASVLFFPLEGWAISPRGEEGGRRWGASIPARGRSGTRPPVSRPHETIHGLSLPCPVRCTDSSQTARCLHCFGPYRGVFGSCEDDCLVLPLRYEDLLRRLPGQITSGSFEGALGGEVRITSYSTVAPPMCTPCARRVCRGCRRPSCLSSVWRP